MQRLDLLRRRIIRTYNHLCAELLELAADVLLHAVVHQRDRHLLIRVFAALDLLHRGALHRVRHAVGAELLEIDVLRVRRDDAVHDAALADDLRERTRVDTAEADHAALFKKGVKIALRTEI